MKAAVFHKSNAPVSIEDLEIEALQEGESLLDVVAAGVSHSNFPPHSWPPDAANSWPITTGRRV